MVPNLANQCQFAAFSLIAAATDVRLLSICDPRSTRHIARRIALIPSSPVSRIMPRIVVGNLLRKVSPWT